MSRNVTLLSATWAAALCCAVLPVPSAAQPSDVQAQPADRLETAVARMAADLARYLNNDREAGKQLRLEPFRGPNGAVNARVLQLLREHLGRTDQADRGFQFVTGGAYTISGRISMPRDEATGTFLARLDVTLLNRSNNQVHSAAYTITDLQDTLSLVGSTFETPRTEAGLPRPSAIAEEAAANLGQGAKVFIHEAVVKATPESPYGLQLLLYDKRSGSYAPIAPTRVGGVAQFPVALGQEFAIRVVNQTQQPVGALITVDGINVFHFSRNEAFRKLGKVIILPNGDRTEGGLIKGFHHEGDISHAFEVTHYGDSAAAELGITSQNVGAITVVFFSVIAPRDPSTPPNIPESEVGVRRGEPRHMPYKLVAADFGQILGSITVRYTRGAAPDDLPPP
jgi:hypothetical protein